MHRTVLGLGLLLSACAAQASQFQIAPTIIAVDQGKHSAELTLSYIPSQGITAAEVNISMSLDRLGWVQVTPAASTSAYHVDCRLTGGRVAALVFELDAGALPVQSIPLCRVRVRPHLSTAAGNYYLSLPNAAAYDIGLNPRATSVNYARVIVE